MSHRVHRNTPITSKPSNIVYPYNEQSSYNKNIYNQKLQQLKQYKSPANIFYDIDTLFLTLGKIKREYTTQWQTHQSYKRNISSFLKSDSTTAIPPAIQEISLFLSEMDKVTHKLNDWIRTLQNKSQHILHTLPKKRSQKKPKHENKNQLQSLKLSPEDSIFNVEDLTEFISPTIHKQKATPKSLNKSKSHDTPNERDRNIRPSHIKRLSETITNDEINKLKRRKHKKHKRKMKKKRRNTDALYNVSISSQESNVFQIHSMSKQCSRDSLNSLVSISTLPSIKSSNSKHSNDSQRSSVNMSFGD